MALNPGLCSRLERQDNFKSIQMESGAFAILKCNLNDEYLYNFIDWKKDQQFIDFNNLDNPNIFLTWKKGF